MSAQPGTNMPVPPAVAANAAGTADLPFPAASDAPFGFVFQPSGGPYPNGSAWSWNKTNSWAALVNKVLAQQSALDSTTAVTPLTILFDDVFAEPTLDVALNFTQQTTLNLGSARFGDLVTVTLSASINGLDTINIDDILIQSDNATVAPITGPFSEVNLYRNAQLIGAFGFPIIQPTIGDAPIYLYDQSVLNGNSVDFSVIGSGVVWVYDSAIIEPNALIGATTIILESGTCQVDPSYYPICIVHGLYVDNSGEAVGNLDPTVSPGAVLSDATTGILYLSNGTSWNEIGNTGAVPSTVVFTPGASDTENIAGDEGTLLSLLDQANGAPTSVLLSANYTVTGSPFRIPRGVTWYADGASGGPVTLTFGTANQLQRMPECIQGHINFDVNLASPTTAAHTEAGYSEMTVAGSARVLSDSGYLISVNASATHITYLHDSASVGDGSGNPIYHCANAGTLEIWCCDNSNLDNGTVVNASGGNTTIWCASPSATIHPTLYPLVKIVGALTDTSGTAYTLIPAAGSAGQIIADTILGVNWRSNGTIWEPQTLSSIVFKPGGGTGPNEVSTEAALVAALAGTNGSLYTITYDFSEVSGAYTFTTVGSLALPVNGQWTDGGGDYDLTFANGTTLPFPPVQVDGQLQIIINQTEDVCTPSGTGVTVIGGYCGLFTSSAGNGAFIHANGQYWTVQTYGYVGIEGAASNAPPLTSSAGGTVEIDVFGHSYLRHYAALPGAGGSIVIVVTTPNVIDASLYPYIFLEGFFIDPIGSGYTLISPTGFGEVQLLMSGNVLWRTNGTAWVPVTPLAGMTTLVNGVSPSISVPYSDGSSVYLFQYGNANATVSYGTLLPSNVTHGVGSDFKITSYSSPGVVNASDQSDVFWSVMQTTPTSP